jgi:predicted DNA-binding transcriptional regulator YafY
MYGGEEVKATLLFDNNLVNVVLDYFGSDATLVPCGESHFELTAYVAISPVFLAWIFQFGNSAKIKSPDSLISDMQKLVAENAQNYKN